VIIVILYWLTRLPQLGLWRNELEVALHTAVVAVSLQLVAQAAFAARRVAAQAWQLVKSTGRGLASGVRNASRWVADRVDVDLRFRMGWRPLEES
jgi:hypothetical protein